MDLTSSTTISGSEIFDNAAAFSGGGIYATGGTLAIEHSKIHDNAAMQVLSGLGGGIATKESFTTITDSQIYNNTSNGDGGGVSATVPLIVRSSEISSNTAQFAGGGILASGRILKVEDSIIADNTADGGGGIAFTYLLGGTATIANSEIIGNSAIGLQTKFANSGIGGGLLSMSKLQISSSTIDSNWALKNGGGICEWLSSASIANSTISNNAANAGGGIWGSSQINQSTISTNTADIGGGIYAQTTSIDHSTIVFNRANVIGGGIFIASSLDIDHTIVAGSSFSSAGDIVGLLGTTVIARYSLIGTNLGSGLVEAPVGSPDADGNLIGGPVHGTINPRLGALTANGGSTMTHALLPGSPAIDAGDPTAVAGVDGVPVYDQRGVPRTRVYGGRIDIGAVESQPDVLLGDYNLNGVVDAADYALWRKAEGTTDLRADGNGDGQVNDADYTVWRANFGATYQSLGTAGTISASAINVDLPLAPVNEQAVKSVDDATTALGVDVPVFGSFKTKPQAVHRSPLLARLPKRIEPAGHDLLTLTLTDGRETSPKWTSFARGESRVADAISGRAADGDLSALDEAFAEHVVPHELRAVWLTRYGLGFVRPQPMCVPCEFSYPWPKLWPDLSHVALAGSAAGLVMAEVRLLRLFFCRAGGDRFSELCILGGVGGLAHLLVHGRQVAVGHGQRVFGEHAPLDGRFHEADAGLREVEGPGLISGLPIADAHAHEHLAFAAWGVEL